MGVKRSLNRFLPFLKPLLIRVIVFPTTFLFLVRRLRILAQARRAGGTAHIAQDVQFNRPVIFQGKGSVEIATGVSFGYLLAGASQLSILLQPRERRSVIAIGRGSRIMNGTEIIARTSIHIGAGCRIGARVLIIDADFHDLAPEARDTPGMSQPVCIADNVLMGIGAVVLKGVTIGRDAVVGAACVVTKDVPDGAIVAGNPMRIVGSVYDRQ